MPELKPGTKLADRFTLLRSVRGSGARQVWLAHDHELDQDLVLKLLTADASADEAALLRRECRSARRLAHPNIVRVFEFHRDGGLAFIAMEAVDGPDLTRLRGAPLTELLDVAIPLADALAHAHRLGIVHRDLKASNVLLDPRRGPRIVDFGIADLFGAAGDGGGGANDGMRLRGGGSRPGASPQQLAGAAASPSDDVYALGALLFELIAGQRHDDPAAAGTLHGIRGIPDALAELVEGMLSPEPEGRPEEMAAVRDALRTIRDGLDEGAAVRSGEITLTPPPRAARVRPGRPQPRIAPRERSGGRDLLRIGAVLLSIAVPAAAAAAIFVFLPRWSESLQARGTAPAAPATPATDPAAPAPGSAALERAREEAEGRQRDSRERARARLRVEELGARAEELESRLAELAAPRWAGAEFRAASRAREEGAAAAAEQDLAAAEALFGDAIDGFEALEARVEEAYAAALERGAKALADGDAAAAEEAFDLAGRIRPGATAAAEGGARADALDSVLAELAAAGRLERAGDLAGAERRYAAAAELDGMNVAAREGLARVRGLIADADFAAAMSSGLQALEDGDYAAAREALGRAAAMRPGSAEVTEALSQAQESLKLDAIAVNRIRAEGFEGEERWRDAADRYRAVLELDPSIAFAREGRRRCLERADLEQSMQYHVDHPERLAADEVLEEARELVAEAQAIVPAGPRHRELTSRLEAAVSRASIPVEVVLESDDETEVVLYRVGRLGTFLRRRLELRPGRYTVVGSRRGYRDVRHELVVLPDEPPEPLVVRCEEAI
jgi:hypothetical protein